MCKIEKCDGEVGGGGGLGPLNFYCTRRRRPTISSYLKKYPPSWKCIIFYLIVLVSSLVNVTEACSSRSTPKPRPPVPTARPNITFLTYECPPAYAAWFCLNGATCFTVKIGDSLLYNCLCTDGYQGSRCEYKELDGSYMPSQRRFMLETASIAGGVAIAIVATFIFGFIMYLKWHRNEKQTAAAAIGSMSPSSSSSSSAADHVDGISYNHHHRSSSSNSSNHHHHFHSSPIFGVHITQEHQRQRRLVSPIPIIHSHINNNHRRPPDYEHRQLGNNTYNNNNNNSNNSSSNNNNAGSIRCEPDIVVPLEIDDRRRVAAAAGGGRGGGLNDNLNRPNVPLETSPAPPPPQDRGDNTATLLLRGAPPWAV